MIDRDGRAHLRRITKELCGAQQGCGSPRSKKGGGSMLPDPPIAQAVCVGHLLDLAETARGNLHAVSCLFEPPDEGRKELSVGGVIEVDPDPHFLIPRAS